RGATLTQPDTALLHYGQKVRIPVTANDSNVTLSTLVIVTPPQYGQATPDTNGNILYIHTNGTAVKDTFTYQVNGPGGLSAATLVTVFLTNALRLPNTNLNIPANPPPTTYFFTNAFPTLSFSSPLCLAVPNGETNRLFVCEKGGAMKVVTNTVTGTPGVATFLNLSGLLTSRNETIATGCEQGLLGLTFHPGYNTNRYFYLYYSVTSNSVTYERLSRFTALTANPNAADTNSEVIYFSQTDTACNHNGGDLHFGPDGYLYISLGDGGDQNDTQDHAQKITNGFFSGLARIDVDKRPGNPAPNIHTQVPRYGGNAAYAVPSDNPYLNATNFNGAIFKATNVFTELYAVGLRNPWRFYIDFTTSNLWCGNVGQDAFEGVYLITNAQNCGWPYYEQSHPGPKSGSTPAGFKYTPPVWDYPHGSSTYQGNCMIGGILYRGRQIPSLYGYYLCADYVSGNCWALWLTNGVITSSNRIAGQAGLVGFTADPNNGDLLAANITSGQIVRLASATPTNSYPLNLS
ncbi:MAG TPA: PQQ-dependent sugar dehydrogenase, partial [Verrucomicrobiae bacterium]